jgi:hypothetical protein
MAKQFDAPVTEQQALEYLGIVAGKMIANSMSYGGDPDDTCAAIGGKFMEWLRSSFEGKAFKAGVKGVIGSAYNEELFLEGAALDNE